MTKALFCAQCGAATHPGAAFCGACGTSLEPTATPPRAPWQERYAAALILGGVLLVAGAAVGIGALRQPPPVAEIASPAGGGGMDLPEGHPPLQIPDDVLKVIQRMEKLAADQPENLDAWKQLAFVQYRTAQVSPDYLNKAEESYKHVLKIDPRDLDALRGLGNVAYDRNDAETALARYREFLAIQPGDKGVLTDMGTMQLAARRPEEAIATYQSVLQQDPNFFQAQFNLAIAYRAAGQNDLALAALQRAREVADDDEARRQVDVLLQRIEGAGAGPAQPAGAAAPAGAEPGGAKESIESVFRSHPIVGPRLERVDWEGERKARVLLRDFPMDGMPPMVRDKFNERVRSGIRDSKQRLQITDTFEIQIVDAASGRVMETVEE
jgi:tetratricopeptide (TPR) repeat protein